ncbi:1-acyl-sn-glycerol-3-phosphate acyltransferase [Leptolyngbya sp. FACHB-711]|uniref:1-acyl-sn-glycerol-3-phosphate acyltransferase n=1 Tax=unclassified Leptolyngbya TaxID=2650499 RepID=UPI001682E4CC|nr:1-acyl-sn-glycerol-3-phosphate acyltransferase [Leptolyngbya sp. FACHB-711]MBD1849455.1 1-acyl-sn-glycerol-3-phosphate acyltransferase [Cyanobacteria bacterium FACHB-502]MBD2027829.1 1-acyl-sn-glycerol-3-phosphate acyltransferase [Leptolyngbya sp. FACHB-711]
MPNFITQAQPPLEFLPPNYDPLVRQMTHLAAPSWIRWREQVVDIEANQVETLVKLYEEFQAGKVRFMMAFRHPSSNDPLCMFHLVSRCVPRTAATMGIRLQAPVHSHFIYDRGIPLWAGSLVSWLYPRLGGTPIRRGKVDLPGLRSARQLFAEGQFPIAAAPEGATNGHNEIVSPIEPGVAQFGFWCQEDLHKAGRTERVVILPIGIQYHYVSEPWEAIDRLMTELETDCGLAGEVEAKSVPLPDEAKLTPAQERQYRRLIRLGEHLLTQMEQFYIRFYHRELKAPTTLEAGTGMIPTPSAIEASDPANIRLAMRLQTLLNTALSVAEEFFKVLPKGTLTDRCRRLEQAGWDWIYREDIKDIEQLPPVERGLADRIAEESDLRLWHMRLVETFVSVTGRYVLEKPTAERFAEMLLLVWDTVTRLKGKFPFPRPRLGKQKAFITIGEPISISDRWSGYQTNRRQAVATLTQDLQNALEQMIFSQDESFISAEQIRTK